MVVVVVPLLEVKVVPQFMHRLVVVEVVALPVEEVAMEALRILTL